MKKCNIVIVVLIVMTFTLAACGKASTDALEENTVQNTSVEKEDEAKGEEVSSEDESSNTEGNTDEDKEDSDGPSIDIETHYYDAGEDAVYIYGYYPSVTVTGTDYPELKDALDYWSDDYKSGYESQMQEYTQNAKLDAEIRGDEYYGYTFEYSAKAARLDNRITSIAVDEYSYAGGAHGYNYLYGVTFDTQTGTEIVFEDLGDIRAEVRTYVDAYINEKRNDGYMFDFYEETIEDYMNAPVWYLDGLGLNIIFNAYDISTYAEGATVVTIPYEEMTDFNSDYKPEGAAVFAQLWLSKQISVDIDADTVIDVVELVPEYDENGDVKLSVKVNDLRLDLDVCARFTSSYFVRTKDGRSFVLVSCDMMSDDYVTQLIEVSSGTPEKRGEVEGNLISMSNQMFIVDANVYVLGTYGSKRTYTFSDGVLQPVEDRYTFGDIEDNTNRTGPVLKTALTVLIDENGTMVQRELAAGTRIYPVNSDGETVVGFKLEDGTYGEINFERQDYIIYIDGVSEYDLFDELPYVG